MRGAPTHDATAATVQRGIEALTPAQLGNVIGCLRTGTEEAHDRAARLIESALERPFLPDGRHGHGMESWTADEAREHARRLGEDARIVREALA